MTEPHYIIVDIETTGLSRERHRITEIAAVRFDGIEIIDEWQTLINPRVPIPSFITRLTGITDAMVADQPAIEDVLPSFFEFLGEDIFVAHNASFDYGFISYNASHYLDHKWTNEILCTRKLANRVVSHLPSKKLESLCEHYGIINTQAHRAMADVLATTEVLKNFLDMFRRYHTSSSIEELLYIQKKPVGFGREIFS